MYQNSLPMAGYHAFKAEEARKFNIFYHMNGKWHIKHFIDKRVAEFDSKEKAEESANALRSLHEDVTFEAREV